MGISVEQGQRILRAIRQLADLRQLTPEQLVRQRYQKFRAMGVFTVEG